MSASVAVTPCELASIIRSEGGNFLPVTGGLVPTIHERLRGYLVDARTAKSGHDGEWATRRGLTSAPPKPYSIPPSCM
jgi:hypothetical protein